MIKRIFLFSLFIFNFLAARPNYHSLNIVANWTITLYKKFISPFQGKNICNFSPSCSQFSKMAINDYGFFTGLVMTSDRLIRCNPGAWQYLDYYYFGTKDGRIFDPPENHYLLTRVNNQLEQKNKSEGETKIIPESISEKNFADYLFNNKDFTRASTEYKRLFFTSNNHRIKQYANMMLAESYLANSDFESALNTFSMKNDSDLTNYCLYGQARTYLSMGNFQESRKILFDLKIDNLKKQSRILTGWTYFKEDKFKLGASYFDSLDDDTILVPLVNFNGNNLTRRNRLLSTTLSAVLPGSGQIYSGRFGDGLYSFLTIATTATLSYYYWRKDESKIKFSIFAFLTGLFWAGNIYGANIAARDYNHYQLTNYRGKIDKILNRIDFKPDYQFILSE